MTEAIQALVFGPANSLGLDRRAAITNAIRRRTKHGYLTSVVRESRKGGGVSAGGSVEYLPARRVTKNSTVAIRCGALARIGLSFMSFKLAGAADLHRARRWRRGGENPTQPENGKGPKYPHGYHERP